MAADPQRIGHESMSCLDCGYILDGLAASAVRACPECGCEFDPADAQTFARILADPVRIARLPIAEAIASRLALEHAGIHSTIEHEQAGILGVIDVPRGAVWVGRRDVDAAQRTLAALVASAHPPCGPWTCPQCAEHIDAEFDVCWNCQCERGAIDAAD